MGSRWSAGDMGDMNTAATTPQPSAQERAMPDRTSAAARLESALGGDLMRFLLTALAAAPSTRPDEPR
jgi:hypothetical protein